MSDKLNQVGKAIGRTKKQAEFLLSRIGERFPQIERLRDTFSNAFPFLMEFETEVERNSLSLDLYFNPTYDFTQLCENFNVCQVEDTVVTTPCNTVDSMQRTKAIGWGLSDISGLAWDAGEFNDNFSITPGHAVYNGPGSSGFGAMELKLQSSYATTTPTEALAQFTFPSTVGTSTVAMTFYLTNNDSRIYALDMYRVGDNLDAEPYARHGGNYDFPGYVSNVLTSIVGVPFNVRLRIESTLVTWRIWKASDPEPNTWTLSANPPSSQENTLGYSINDVVFQYQSSGITSEVNYFAFVEGYIGCGKWVGGTETTDYYISNKVASSHSADAHYHRIQGRRWSALNGYDFTNANPFRAQSFHADFVQFAWFAVGGGNVKSIKVRADPFFGMWNTNVSPQVPTNFSPEIMQVAAWATPYPLHNQPPDFFFPLNTSIDISNYGGGISIQAWVGNSLTGATNYPVPDVTADARNIDWQGGEGLYPNGAGDVPPAPTSSTLTYEPFVVEVVTIIGGTWVSDSTTPSPPQVFPTSCIAPDGIIQLQYSYTSASVIVKFNDKLLTRAVDYFETSPALGKVTITTNYLTGKAEDILTICYNPTGNPCNESSATCGFDDLFNNRVTGPLPVAKTGSEYEGSFVDDPTYTLGNASETGQQWFNVTQVEKLASGSLHQVTPPNNPTVTGTYLKFLLNGMDLPAVSPSGGTGQSASNFSGTNNTTRLLPPLPITLPIEVFLDISTAGDALQGHQYLQATGSPPSVVADLRDSITMSIGNTPAWALAYDLVDLGSGSLRQWFVGLSTSSAAFAFTPTGHFYVRLRITSGAISIKTWNNGEVEPAYSGPYTFNTAAIISQANFVPFGAGFRLQASRAGSQVSVGGPIAPENAPPRLLVSDTEVLFKEVKISFPDLNCGTLVGGCPDLIVPTITAFAGIFYPKDVKVWLNNTDITYNLFDIDTLNPDDITNTWRNIDISNYIRDIGRQKLKITTSSTGKAEARLTIH